MRSGLTLAGWQPVHRYKRYRWRRGSSGPKDRLTLAQWRNDRLRPIHTTDAPCLRRWHNVRSSTCATGLLRVGCL